ncbi:MAG: FAD-binding oxidoreductase [Halobacteriovoraceae bacterium]|nr:FAD-binding oxidoreductase [Halobacteriovoraceae bacterium]
MEKTNFNSWGRLSHKVHKGYRLGWKGEHWPESSSYLPFGLGRSYGDSCLNSQGLLLGTSQLDHLISFSDDTGELACESGVSLLELNKIFIPRGWFIPVTPGTQFVTVGGAIANDVHGKNHHKAGTFGCHVKAFDLLRSGNEKLRCSKEENSSYYKATIGGLGLTGLITQATLQMKKIKGPWIDQEIIPFKNLDEYFQLAIESDQNYEYTVSWVDCLARGPSLGRGLFIRGNHSSLASKKHSLKQPINIPFNFPDFSLNSLSIKIFNTLYFYKTFGRKIKNTVSYVPFFYPLDSLTNWNRIYGRRGFFQYQCVIPMEKGAETIRELFKVTSHYKEGSFLAVLKNFGSLKSPGIMSFPREGMTLCLDFPNKGSQTKKLMNDLDKIVLQGGGALYPAKDARMSLEMFESSFPNWREFLDYIDPQFHSDFWSRIFKK